MLSGKKQADSEKNLQTIFKEYYDTAKDVNVGDGVKNYVNSAKNSIGSLSSVLEQRRQRFKQMRERKETGP